MNSRNVRRTLDRLAYVSLVLDICIAVVTTLGLLNEGSNQRFLVPINYLLTVVVILSVILFIVLLLFRSKENKLEP